MGIKEDYITIYSKVKELTTFREIDIDILKTTVLISIDRHLKEIEEKL